MMKLPRFHFGDRAATESRTPGGASLRSWQRLRKPFGATLLLSYMATLVVAACPGEIRPAWLDDVHDRANNALFYTVGIVAGEPLFHAEETSPWMRRAFCVKVKGQSSIQGKVESVSLFPPGEACQVSGFRFRLPPMDRALHRILVHAWEMRPGGPNPHERSDATLERIARHFCTYEGPGGSRQDSVSLIWYWYYEHFDVGVIRHLNALKYRWECNSAQLQDRSWMMDDPTFEAFWGTAPWE